MYTINSAEFLLSSSNPDKCPKPDKPEYAFIGRSNVGKSSLINMLTNHKNLAKTSSTPGKTQLINHFLIDNFWYLVDLPGYGYAKSSKKNRKLWYGTSEKYIKARNNLMCMFLLIDSRLVPQRIDLDFMEYLAINEIPFVLVYTKTDKLSKNELQSNVAHYKKILLQTWEQLPPVFISSAETKQGRSELLQFIEETNKLFKYEG